MFRVLKALLLMFIVLFTVTGCQRSKIMPVESSFSKVTVGQNTSDELLDMLGDAKLLQTTDKISVLNNTGKFRREVGIASVEPDSSTISRFVYMSRDKNLTDVKLRIVVSTKVGPEVLLKPYATASDKSLAILRYCHQALRGDTMEFANDQESHDLMNLASMVLGIGIAKLEVSPRDISDINTENGFTYEHTTAGECKLRLEQQENSDIYTLSVHTRGPFDWMVKW